jgi:DNA-binding CsgD family transcriptional regulator
MDAVRTLQCPLSKAETRVANLVADGLTNDEIARHLGVGIKTVECQITSAFRKTGVRNRVSLAMLLILDDTARANLSIETVAIGDVTVMHHRPQST